MKISVIQLKRGIRTRLVASLRGINAPKEGEPIYEIDSGKLYIGDGVTDFEFLDPIAGNGGDIQIESATDGQTLVYNETLDKWEAKNLADGQSIEYGENGLRIAGFTGQVSQNGLFPMANNGNIIWQSPVSDADLSNAVETARNQANKAEQEALSAENSAALAARDAANTALMVEQTAALYGSKFWYGTVAEYTTEVVNAGKLTEGTIYFIIDNN